MSEPTFEARELGYRWSWPGNARKAHLYHETAGRIMSACGAVLMWGEAPPLQSQKVYANPGPDDCVRCHRKARREYDRKVGGRA